MLAPYLAQCIPSLALSSSFELVPPSPATIRSPQSEVKSDSQLDELHPVIGVNSLGRVQLGGRAAATEGLSYRT